MSEADEDRVLGLPAAPEAVGGILQGVPGQLGRPGALAPALAGRPAALLVGLVVGLGDLIPAQVGGIEEQTLSRLPQPDADFT